MTYLAIFLILWGAGTASVAYFKPEKIWQIGKIQGFVQLIGDQGTTILFSVLGVAAFVGGILILVL